jgi:quaternary ammonium compound-resistance protein SugE
MMAWLYLYLAGAFEIGFTTFLKLSDGFSKLVPTAMFVFFAVISFALLNKSIQTIPLGTSYAVWTGIGATGTVIVGILFFGDPVSFWRVFFMAMLIISLVGVKLAS